MGDDLVEPMRWVAAAARSAATLRRIADAPADEAAGDAATRRPGGASGQPDPRRAAWQASAVAVGLHLAETGRCPAGDAADPEVRRLANWLRTQRRAERAGRLAPDRLAWLELNLPSWRHPGEESWAASAGLLEDFCCEQGRLPVDAPPADDRERRLARWLRRQREAAADDRLDDDRRLRLDAVAPGWFDPAGARWLRAARAAAAWIGRRGTPSKHAADPNERRLGEWLAAQRRAEASGALRPERARWLDRSMPAWRQAPDGAWRSRLDELRRFVASEGRLPQRRAVAGDHERRLAGWLADQRSAERAGRLAEPRRRLLDALVVGWSDDEREWRRSADRLARHLAEHGAFPAARDAAPEVAALARWVQRQRRLAEAGALAPARERWLDRQSAGWRDRGLAAWQETATRVERFSAEHGRLPLRAAEAPPLERELGVWLGNQRAAHRSGALSADRARLLDERLPEWRDPRLAAWLRRAHEVAEFFDELGRLPSLRSTQERSRELGGWLDTQRRAMRRGGLDAVRLDWLDARLPGWAGEFRGGVLGGDGLRPVRPAAGAGRAPEVAELQPDRRRVDAAGGLLA